VSFGYAFFGEREPFRVSNRSPEDKKRVVGDNVWLAMMLRPSEGILADFSLEN
jgi:hypothetical protein